MLKAPDLWWSLSQELGLDEETFSRYFEYGDYGEIEIEVDETLKNRRGAIHSLREPAVSARLSPPAPAAFRCGPGGGRAGPGDG